MFASGMYLAHTGYVNVNKNPKYKIKHTEIPNIVNKVQNIKQNIKLKQKSLEDNILSNTYYYEIDSLKQNYKQIIKTEEYKKKFQEYQAKKAKEKERVKNANENRPNVSKYFFGGYLLFILGVAGTMEEKQIHNWTKKLF